METPLAPVPRPEAGHGAAPREAEQSPPRPRWVLSLSAWILLALWAMRSSPALAPVPPAKNVVVYRNGDPFFGGRRMVVNQRRLPTLEAFLSEVTRSVGAAVAVRNLYTPRRGRRVARLGDLRDGCHYVAAGSESFKRLDYLSCGVKQLGGTGNSTGLRRRVAASWEPHVPAPRQPPVRLPCTIHVFRNGDLLSPPFRLPLSRSTSLERDALLTLLTDRVNLRGGAVRKLCRLDGAQVSGGEELVDGGYYVAVGAEEYQNLPYVELLVPPAPGYRALRNHPNSRSRNHGAWLDSRRAQTTEAAEKDKIPTASPGLQKQPRKPPLQGEESLFHARPVRAGRNRKSNMNVQHWPDQEGGVYKAKDPRREMRGAHEVTEDEHTKAEVPIDQTAANIVEEEFIQKAKMRSHNKVWSGDKPQRSVATRRDAGDPKDGKHGMVSSLSSKEL